MTDRPVACSLDAKDYAERQSRLRAGILGEALGTERIPRGLRWRFATTPDLLSRLGPILDAERQCCRSLTLSLSAAADRGEVVVEVTGPRGTQEMLETWLIPPSA